MAGNVKYSGSCACGNITYTAFDLKPILYCHCRQCRRMTGHFMAASQVALDKITITGKVKWFYVSKKARHGFCDNCGAQMFWIEKDNDYMSVTLGCVDDTKKLTARAHVFTIEKGDYYNIIDNYPQFLKWSNFNPKG